MSKDRFKQELPILPSGSQPENPCFSCGACCTSSFMPIVADYEVDIIIKGFPHVTELQRDLKKQDDLHERRNALADIHEEGKKGYRLPQEIVYTELEYPGFYSLAQIGPCPQLDKDNRCKEYPRRPLACVNFEVGETACNDRRVNRGLPRINPDGTVIPSETFRQRATRTFSTIYARFRKS